jgi:hypothetical protein
MKAISLAFTLSCLALAWAGKITPPVNETDVAPHNTTTPADTAPYNVTGPEFPQLPGSPLEAVLEKVQGLQGDVEEKLQVLGMPSYSRIY